MNTQIKIYIASPLGFSEVGRDFMYNRIIPQIQSLGYKVIDPWEKTPSKTSLLDNILSMPLSEKRANEWRKINYILGQDNAKRIEESTGLFAILDGVDVDSGTASEIGYASALSKKILGYRGDFRLSADNEGGIVNLQVEYFISRNGGKIIDSIDKMKPELKRLFG